LHPLHLSHIIKIFAVPPGFQCYNLRIVFNSQIVSVYIATIFYFNCDRNHSTYRYSTIRWIKSKLCFSLRTDGYTRADQHYRYQQLSQSTHKAGAYFFV